MKWKFVVRPVDRANKSAPICVEKFNLGDWRWTLIRTQIIVLAESFNYEMRGAALHVVLQYNFYFVIHQIEKQSLWHTALVLENVVFSVD